MTTIPKAVLQLQHQQRRVFGILLDTFILPAECPLVEPLRQEISDFMRDVERRREEAKTNEEGSSPLPMGPPHLTLSLSLLESLIAADIGESQTEAINAIHLD